MNNNSKEDLFFTTDDNSLRAIITPDNKIYLADNPHQSHCGIAKRILKEKKD